MFKRYISSFLFILLFCGNLLSGQDYIAYQRLFNRIDEDVLSKDYYLAAQRLDTIYQSYDFVYARHCIKALQVCCAVNDSFRAEKWLARCFRQGVPLWLIRTNELTRKSLLYANTGYTIDRSDSLYAIYRSNINMDVRRQVDSLMIIDQWYTARVNDGFFLFRHTLYGLQWKKNNLRQFRIIDKITDTYGFPGERLIGLPSYLEDSAYSVRNVAFYGPYLADHRAYTMLIHYFSSPRQDINTKLLQEVKTGNLPARQYGALNDFLARWGRGKYGRFSYYNVWHKDPGGNISLVNELRHSIGLGDYDVQERNLLIERERRKDRRANAEIILE